MKNLFIVILWVVNIVSCKAVYSQSIDETKSFIIETIENNPTRNHTQNADFYPNSTILNYHCYLLVNGAIFLHSHYTFDVKGVKYIRDGEGHTANGALFYKIIVYINAGYTCQLEIGEKGATGNLEYLKSFEITSDSKSELNKIKKALLHLSKLFGGSPSENDLFSD